MASWGYRFSSPWGLRKGNQCSLNTAHSICFSPILGSVHAWRLGQTWGVICKATVFFAVKSFNYTCRLYTFYKARGEPFIFRKSVLCSTALSPIRRMKQLWSSVLLKETSARTWIGTHTLTTPYSLRYMLEPSAPDRSAMTLCLCRMFWTYSELFLFEADKDNTFLHQVSF